MDGRIAPARVEQSLVDLTFRPEDEIGILSGPITRIAAELAGENQLTAPIRLPPKPELEVKLVNIATLQRLDEIRGDAVLFQNITFVVAGAGLGLLSSLTDGELSSVDGILFAVYIALTLLFGFIWQRYERRARLLRNHLFASEASEE